MASTFETVAEIIASTSDVPADKITPDAHVMKDLEVDSLGFLDVAFEIDKKFGIRLPIEDWLQNVKDGQYEGDENSVMKHFWRHIEALAGAKAA